MPVFLLGLVCAALSPAARAASSVRIVGLRLLQAQLPVGLTLRRINCERLVKADHAATLAHHKQAVEILTAALSLYDWDERRQAQERLSCVCVVRLFLASVSAAPAEAVPLLEVAEALYPECADNLSDGLRGFEISYNASRDGESGRIASPGDTGTDGGELAMNAPAGSGLNAVGDGVGFGAGIGPGPGFPGSPGFGGSSPGSGFALPTPVPSPVTSAVNN